MAGTTCFADQSSPLEVSLHEVIKGNWILNHNHSSSCPGKLTQFNVSHYQSDEVGNIYLALWTPLQGNTNQYSLVSTELIERKCLLYLSQSYWAYHMSVLHCVFLKIFCR